MYDLEIHQKKLGLDYHILKTMVKRRIEQEIRNKNFGARNGNYERKVVVKIRDQNSVYKEETIAVSATISISVGKLHSRIRLRILSCSRMREKSREPEVPVVECIDGLARITSKELAITHSVKGGTLQNACSTRPRVVADLGKSAHMHTVRLMNSRLKGPKRMMTKVQLLC